MLLLTLFIVELMMKFLSLLCLFLCVSFDAIACTKHDGAYYKINPKALQEAIKQCPNKAPKLVSCDELQNIAIKTNELVYELRISPQAYGQTILNLQEIIANQASRLLKDEHQADLKESFDKNNQILKERLAIVNWLESPES